MVYEFFTKYNWLDVSNFFIVSGLIVLGIYHLMVFFGRIRLGKKQNYYLFFGLFSIFLGIYLTAGSRNLWIILFPTRAILENFDPAVTQLSSLLFTVFLMEFLIVITEFPLKLRFLFLPSYILYGISTFFASFYLFMDYEKFREKWVSICLIFFFIGVFYFYAVFFVKILLDKKCNSGQFKFALAGVIIFTLDIILERIFRHFTVYYPLMGTFIPTGISIFIFSLALSKKFNDEFLELQKLKYGLEKEVEKRTDELKNINLDLMKAKKYVEEKERQKTNFFVNFAHEIKTPLTLIANYLDKYISKNGISSSLVIMKNNISRLLKDVDNYLDMEKLEKGGVIYNHDQLVDISDFLINKIKIFKSTFELKKIKIDLNIEDKLFVKIDPFALDRILNNIFYNSYKYSEDEGSVSVSLRKNCKKIELSISDTGIGIKENKLKNIFKPFYQISNKKRNIQGIGLGLNLVKKIIDELDGEISIYSNEGAGTVVNIIFRGFTGKACEMIKDFDVSKSFINGGFTGIKINKDYENFDKFKNTILLVEDNIELLAYLQDSFSRFYNTCCALNGKEAVSILKSINIPDLIISDIMMDEMDGYEFYNFLSRDNIYSKIPFIFLTVKKEDYEKISALSKGAVDYITKPFLFDELNFKVRSMLNITKSKLEEGKKAAIKRIKDFINNDSEMNLDEVDLTFKKYNITESQKKIIDLIMQGFQNKEIADMLNIKYSSVKTLINRLFKKCGVSNRVELTNLFRKE